jgi:hypothetical protein
MKEDMIYRKVGKRYIKIGHGFRGFPMDGIWLVKDGKNNQICLISKDENPPILALPYRMYSEELTMYLMNKTSKLAHSWRDIGMLACDFFAKKSEDAYIPKIMGDR